MNGRTYIHLIVHNITRGENELFQPGSSLTAEATAETVK